MTEQHKPLILLILDGFGYSDIKTHNAISNADAPVWQARAPQDVDSYFRHGSGSARGPDG